MKKYSQNTYDLIFSEDYKELSVIEKGTGVLFDGPYCLEKGLKVWIENGDYCLETYVVKEFNLSFSPDTNPSPIRFADNDWIGSGDLRDTRVAGIDFTFHLNECPVIFLWNENRDGFHPQVVVRSPCPDGSCAGPASKCVSDTPSPN